MKDRTKVVHVASFVVLLAGSAACQQKAECPEVDGPATSIEPRASGEVYVGPGNPYAPGPLAVRVLDIERCENGAPAPLLIMAPELPGRYPVVVFLPGFLTRNDAYSEILHHLAGHGFVVAAPQAYELSLAALLGSFTTKEEAAIVVQVLDWLPGGLVDLVGYVPDSRLTGLAGHSRGGKVAWLVLMADRSRALAVAGIDPVDSTGGPLGDQPRVTQDPFSFSLPVLVLGTGLGGACAPAGSNHEQFYAASMSPAWHIVVPGQGHADMLDESVAAVATVLCPGGPDREGMRRLTAGLLVAFFRASLQGDVSAYTYLKDAASAPIPFEVATK